MRANFHPLRAEASRVILRTPDYPEEQFDGRGIVMCAGGPTYFVQAWVGISLLRELGCTLPIQVWHRDASELTPTMRRLLQSHDVEFVNAQETARDHQVAKLPGWAIKPFAILHSRFREVLYLDSDSLPTRDPAYLFDDASYRATGSLFWTDRYRGRGSAYSTVHPRAWAAMNVAKREEPECESGQLIVDKSAVWRELNLCLHFNFQAQSYYRFIYGDKDTFRFAWHRLGRTFNTVPFGPSSPPNFRVLYQLDPRGEVVFQHRARAKWTVRGENLSIDGFQHQEACQRYLTELDGDWDQILLEWRSGGSVPVKTVRESIASDPQYACFLNGRFAGPVVFSTDGSVTSGVKHLPTHWQVIEQPDGSLCVALMGDRAAPILLQQRDGVWFGVRVAGKRETVSLVPRARFAESAPPARESNSGQELDDDKRFECNLLGDGEKSGNAFLVNVKEGEDQNGTESAAGNASPRRSREMLSTLRDNSNGTAPTESSGKPQHNPPRSDLKARSLQVNGNRHDLGVRLEKIANAFDEATWSTSGDPLTEDDESWSGNATSGNATLAMGALSQGEAFMGWSGDEPETWSGDQAGFWSGDMVATNVEPYLDGSRDVLPDVWSIEDGFFEQDIPNQVPDLHRSAMSPTLLGGPRVAHATGAYPSESLATVASNGEAGSRPEVTGSAEQEILSYIKIYGMPRTCTNLVTHLLRENFHAEVFANRLGWKHGPNLFREGDRVGNHMLKFVICVRHPYSWLVSFYRFEVQGRGLTCSFADFVRGTCNTYRGRNPIERYNLLVRMWQGLAVNPECAQIVRSETLQDDQHATLKEIAKQLKLRKKHSRIKSESRRIGPDEQIRRKEFDMGYYRDHRYFEHYDSSLLKYVNERVDRDLMSRLEYRLLSDVPTPIIAGQV